MEQQKNLAEDGLPASSTETSTSSEDGFISEDDLRAMSLKELIDLIRDNVPDAPASVKQMYLDGDKDGMIAYLTKEFGV